MSNHLLGAGLLTSHFVPFQEFEGHGYGQDDERDDGESWGRYRNQESEALRYS